jgi:hypothetical protein
MQIAKIFPNLIKNKMEHLVLSFNPFGLSLLSFGLVENCQLRQNSWGLLIH